MGLLNKKPTYFELLRERNGKVDLENVRDAKRVQKFLPAENDDDEKLLEKAIEFTKRYHSKFSDVPRTKEYYSAGFGEFIKSYGRLDLFKACGIPLH